MKKLILNTLAGVITASSLLFSGTAAVQAAPNVQQLLRCDETNMEAGFYGQHYGVSIHGTDQICGGDPLMKGGVRIRGANGNVVISLKGVHAFNLYEVYWLSIGAHPSADRIHLGSVLTNVNGDVHSTVRRSVNTPADAATGPFVSMRTAVGPQEAGVFLLYSRGPWASNPDANGIPQMFNTSDGTVNGSFNNPVLWGGSTTFFDAIQFVSGYRLTRGMGRPRGHWNTDRNADPEFDTLGNPMRNDAPDSRLDASGRTQMLAPEAKNLNPEPDTVRDPEYDELR